MDDRLLLASGARTFSYRSTGDPAAAPLIALHGTPGSRLKFKLADPIARRLDLRVISPDRWGYGGTTLHPRPSLKGFAQDIAELADGLGIGRFAVMGVSGGGPFAAAVASEMPDRVQALALVAPVGPIAGEVDSEMTSFHRFCFGPLARAPTAVAMVFRAFRTALGFSPGLGMRMAMIRVAAADRRVLRQADVAERLGETFVEGLRPGVAGPISDLQIFGAPWDIELSRARMPTRLWIGSEDQNVPRSAAKRLALRLPTCELTELRGEGHLWVANNYATVLGWIAGAIRRG